MLRDQVEGRREVLGEGDTVRQVLENVIARYPSLRRVLFEQGELTPYVNVYVGRADVRTLDGLDTPVGGGPVILLPAMAGGANVVLTKYGTADYPSRTMSAHTFAAIREGLLIVRAHPR